ncbi:MAG: HEAT repeat domain-containing protein, partial [Planctomycetales bacterium]|nr:HEAT repeat domain-containing protein [Planctomycetales bacterium]
WIPAEWQRKLDLRAGDDRGRIYRIVPIDATPTKPPRLDSLDTDGLVAALDSPNGWQRDMAQQMLLWRSDPESLKPLARMTNECDNPLARLHSLYTLDGLRHPLPDALPIELLLAALNDSHPGVRRHAVRLAERRWDESPQVLDVIVRLADDSDPPVRLQVAYSLGESSDPRAAEALARLALRSVDDAYTKAAVMSSITSENIGPMIAAVLKQDAATGRERLLAPLLAQAAIRRSNDAMNQAFAALLDEQFTTFPASRVAALLTVFDAVATQKISLDDLMTAPLRERLDRLHDLSAETVANEQASESDRALAVRLLAARPVDRDETLARLASLLSPRNASSLQSAAIAALAKLGHPRTPELLLADWQSHTPTTRSEIFDALLDQAAWTEPLLAALEQSRVLPSQLDARRRQRLLDHRQSAVRDRAAKLLATTSSSSRQTVVDQYADALKLPADAARGKQVFAKRCSACHQLEGVGHVTGPDLLGLTDKSAGAMLVAMMDPNRAVEDKFLDYVALLSDGRTISGMLAGETGASLTLVAADGKRFEIARSDLEQLRSTGKSLMPEGLERDLTPQDVADVIAYVRGVSQPAKKFDGNEPKPAAVRDDGSIRLLATDCRIYGPRLVFESQYRNLGYWQSEEDRAVWKLDIRKAGRFRVSLDYACDASAAGDRFLLTIAGQTLGGQVPSTGSWNNYQSLTIGDLDLPAGPAEATMRSDGPIRNALLDLRTIRLIPVEK